MRNLVVGVVVGLVIGVVLGSAIVAPRLKLPEHKTFSQEQDSNITKPASRFVSAPRSQRKPAPVHWRMASAYASQMPQMGELAQRLDNSVWHLSDGVFRLKMHEPGTLVPSNQMVDAVRSQAIDAAFAAPSFWAHKNPAFHLFSAIPFGPSAQEYLSWIFDGGGREIMDELYKHQGLHGLVCGIIASEGSGWFRDPIESLEAFKALRIGMGGLGGLVVQQVGAKTMNLNEGDVFVALKKVMIDGAEASQPAVDMDLGLHKIARHYYFPGWHQPATLLHLIVNGDAWLNLPKSRRAQIDAACASNVAHGLAVGEARQFNALREFTKQGVRIHTWSPDILVPLKKAWTKIQVDLAKGNQDFKRVWDSLTKFREEYAIWREISAGTPMQN